MPDGLLVAEAADRHTVFDDVRHDVDLGQAVAIFLDRRMIHVAEPAGESNQIRIRNVLISKYEPRMTDSRLMDGGEASVVSQRL